MATCGTTGGVEEKKAAVAVESLYERHNIIWNMTVIRVKNPEISVLFYLKNFNMRIVKTIALQQLKPPRCSYILETVETAEGARNQTWNNRWTLNLLHFYGDEKDDKLVMNSGNTKPYRGFGHIAFNCDDVYKSCDTLEKNGVKFRKKPNEGRMKGLAFALDPDGYWVEIVSRDQSCSFKSEYNLSQTMIRVKDPKKSLNFYANLLGMSILRVLHFPKEKGDFSLYFVTHLSDKQKQDHSLSKESGKATKLLWQPCLELTHNHGTESDDAFQYHAGQKEPVGFSHLGFQCDDLPGLKKSLEQLGIPLIEEVGPMAMIADPDGYCCVFTDRKQAMNYFE